MTVKWFSDILTGPDNQTIAIGRALGIVLFLNVLIFFPVVIGAVLLARKVEPAVWFSYMDDLKVYVPAMILAIWGLIRGTSGTEPKG